MDLLHFLAVALIVMGILNAYFVYHSLVLYRAVEPRSPLLRAVFGVKLAIWLIGLYVAFVALRVLLGLPPLPFSGIGLGIVILILEMLPFFIWIQIRTFVLDQDLRDRARDASRDAGRDTPRDDFRDDARDIARDQPRDLKRDAAHDKATEGGDG